MKFFTSLLQQLGLLKKKVNVLMVGLDNSGKTTLINNFSAEKISPIDVVPTVGFTISQFNKKNVHITCFDMSGQGKYRDLWEHYYNDTDAIIFVVDLSDKLRCCVARDELEIMLANNGSNFFKMFKVNSFKKIALKEKRVPILFFGNKSDLPDIMEPAECSQILGLENIKNHNCSCNALTGEGLESGMGWLIHTLENE
ncbi:ADP-ribosylation factor-like protein 6 [Clydaea vesicula]|uniref:ADP-ribosylation factor n=1 Tax=Clydaea vesicula TaxID=447962 RepID=A0AAD5U387_9FUNG|nr:ADP-ribosylation factor-like protein 6 [Clydaea vesicula]